LIIRPAEPEDLAVVLHVERAAFGRAGRSASAYAIDPAVANAWMVCKTRPGLLGAIAEFETELRRERQMDGIAKARSRGVRFGRKASLTAEQVTELRQRRAP
jgi:hypothetical protein